MTGFLLRVFAALVFGAIALTYPDVKSAGWSILSCVCWTLSSIPAYFEMKKRGHATT